MADQRVTPLAGGWRWRLWLLDCVSMKWRSIGLPLASLVIGSALTWLAVAPASAPGAAVASEPLRIRRAPPFTQGALAELRQNAGVGDALATRDLAAGLLDRYDMQGDEDDLFEALIWIDRNLYTEQNGDLAARISTRYCEHPVVRWHSLCSAGE